MKDLWRVMKFIWEHPLAKKRQLTALIRFMKWQIIYRIHPYPVIYPFVEESLLVVEKGMTGATGNIYTGLHEFLDMGFLLHFLRQEDLFVDIGANVGSYTVLASAVVKAKTISIEPIPVTFEKLRNNIFYNRLEHAVSAYNVGIGSRKSMLKFTNTFDTVNHALSPGEASENFVEVPVEALDELLGEYMPVLIKVDVEGFELEVLKGATRVLSNQQLQAIIIELNGSGARYGFNEQAIHQLLLDNGFTAYQYEPLKRELIAREEIGGEGNSIYVRNIEQVRNRLRNARKFLILGQLV